MKVIQFPDEYEPMDNEITMTLLGDLSTDQDWQQTVIDSIFIFYGDLGDLVIPMWIR